MVNNRQNTIHGEAIIGLLIAEYSPTVQLANIRQLFAKEHNFCKIFSNFVIKFPIFLDFCRDFLNFLGKIDKNHGFGE